VPRRTIARDYYEVLGLRRDAPAKAIRDAFRQLVLRYHPDRNSAPDAERQFREVTEAYSVLSDPEARKAYDTHGFSGSADASADPPPPPPPPEGFDDLFGKFDFGSLFDGVRPGPRRTEPKSTRDAGESTRGADVQVSLAIPLERVLTGGQETVVVRRDMVCEVCRGLGGTASGSKACSACRGSGQQMSAQQSGGVAVRHISTCSACKGRGVAIDKRCRTCSSRGVVEASYAIRVDVPAGIEEGAVLRIPGRGCSSDDPRGVPGDLVVAVHVLPDPRFARQGVDLYRVQVIGVPEAVLGTTVEVPTLDGIVTAVVPPGTQPGTALRFQRRGLPRVGGGPRGDLVLELRVVVPQGPSREEAELYARLRSLAAAASR
jgi:molecular chaperone DnaJ